MKLRIQNNRIRLRLTKSEIEQLGVNGRVACTTQIPTHPLTYSLNRSPENSVQFSDHQLRIDLVPSLIQRLTDTDEVGVEARVGELFVLVEKDFTCLKARPEEQSGDYYPNPLEQRP